MQSVGVLYGMGRQTKSGFAPTQVSETELLLICCVDSQIVGQLLLELMAISVERNGFEKGNLTAQL